MTNTKESVNTKAPMSLIPSEIMEELARVFERGAIKHGRNNFREEGNVSTYVDATLRHVYAAMSGPGKDIDKDSGCHHFTCAIASLMVARLYIQVTDDYSYDCPFVDDRFIVGAPEDTSNEETDSDT